MSERGQAGDRARARNDAKGGGDALPRRDPGGAGRSRGRIPTRFSRENPPMPATEEPEQPTAASARRGTPRAALEPAPYAIRPGAPALPAQPSSRAEEPDRTTAFSVRPGGPDAPTAQQPAEEAADGAIVGVLVEARPHPPTGDRPTAVPTTAAPPVPRPAAPSTPAAPTASRTRGRGAGPGRGRSLRRRRLLRTAVIAAVVFGGGAALAVSALTGGDRHNAGTSASTAPSSSATAPAGPPLDGTPSTTAGGASTDPLTYLGNAATDTAPLSDQALFPQQTVTVNGRTYTRDLTDATANCGSPDIAASPLNTVLSKNGCRAVYRATYTSGGTAVTVGVAVFDTSGQADTARQQATSGNLESLYGGKTPKFCRMVACRLTTNVVGRYVYLTVAGYTNGKAVPANDTTALAAGDDTSAAVFGVLTQRAQAAASHAGPPLPQG
jgi:hypothetical protein